jgi:hypothetical protein
VFGGYCGSDWKVPLKKDAIEIVGMQLCFIAFTFFLASQF